MRFGEVWCARDEHARTHCAVRPLWCPSIRSNRRAGVYVRVHPSIRRSGVVDTLLLLLLFADTN